MDARLPIWLILLMNLLPWIVALLFIVRDMIASGKVLRAKDETITLLKTRIEEKDRAHAELDRVKDERIAHLERVIADLRDQRPLVVIEEELAVRKTVETLYAAAKAELRAKDQHIEQLMSAGTAEARSLRSERDELQRTLDKLKEEAPSELATDGFVVLGEPVEPYRLGTVVSTATQVAALSGVTFDPQQFRSDLEAIRRYREASSRFYRARPLTPEEQKAIDDARANEAEEQ